jgi:hypothetical protein
MVAVAESVAASHDYDSPEDRWAYCADEIRAALTWTRRAAEHNLSWAYDLIENHPEVGEALARGDIDLAKAKAICAEVSHLDAGEARAVIAHILPVAHQLTTGQIRARVRRLTFAADPDSAEKRYRAGVADRQLTIEANSDGTASIFGLNLPSDRAEMAMNNVHALARRARSSGDSRSVDQVLADVFLSLLSGGDGRHLPALDAQVEVRVGLETLMHLNDEPGDLGGFGPMIAELAREVATASKGWKLAVTDGSGQPLWSGRARRRPGNHLRHLVEARDPVCVFPGCRMPATQSDLDHREPWSEGGPTSEENLVPLCRHDHRLKHDGGWTLGVDESGRWIWTSPLGHRYSNLPEPP